MANPSQRIAEGQLKALMKACNSNKTARLSRLVQVPGMDINKQDLNGETVAHKASNGRAECVRILAETGRVDWNMRNDWDYTPLYYALLGGYSDIVDIIVQQPNIDYSIIRSFVDPVTRRTRSGSTLATAALWGENVTCLETLLSRAPDTSEEWNVPNTLNRDTPIMYAVKYREREVVEMLARDPRVDLDVVDIFGQHVEDIDRLLFPVRIFFETFLISRTRMKRRGRKARVIADISDLLWTFRTVQKRMILRDSLLTRKAGIVPSLQSLSRDAVLLILSTNNTQERLVRPLVDRLGGLDITRQAREILLGSYSGRIMEIN